MILLTGGSGILGMELQKRIECFAPLRLEFDLNGNFDWLASRARKSRFFSEDLSYHDRLIFGINGIKLIVHCAAYTDVLKAETEKELCYQTNVIGTRNVTFLGIPMLYISTEYVFDGEKGDYNETDYPNPQNFYAFTKLLGEYEARRTRSVVIRCLFKPRPFEHECACIDQFTTGDYVEVMAKEIASAVSIFDSLPDTVHIGTEKKSTFELARRSKPDVKPCKLAEISVRLPRDTSLN